MGVNYKEIKKEGLNSSIEVGCKMKREETFEEKRERIHRLVKSLEPFFYGFNAIENKLVNNAGLSIAFYDEYRGTSISGLGGRNTHSIGCSFSKDIEKIAKDIKRRLLPSYRDDFMSCISEKMQCKEKKEKELLLLNAIASACGGKLSSKYDCEHHKEVVCKSLRLEVYQSYSGDYCISLSRDFAGVLDLIESIKKSSRV